MKPKTRSKDREALEWIALLGHGIKAAAVDWANIGKMAVKKAQDQIAGQCECCGHQKEFKPKERRNG